MDNLSPLGASHWIVLENHLHKSSRRARQVVKLQIYRWVSNDAKISKANIWVNRKMQGSVPMPAIPKSSDFSRDKNNINTF